MWTNKTMQPYRFIASLLIGAVLLSPAFADDSMLRLTCEGRNVGAQVFVNGKFKGECPLDLQVAPGKVRLLAKVVRDEDLDWVWEQEVNVGEGVVKKLEVDTNHVHYGEKLRQKFLSHAPTTVKEAEEGDVGSMESAAIYYHQGLGVPQSDERALAWLRKAADTGSVSAMTELGLKYHFGIGVPKNEDEFKSWFKKAAAKGDDYAIKVLKKYDD
jgi:TPR repeat protein